MVLRVLPSRRGTTSGSMEPPTRCQSSTQSPVRLPETPPLITLDGSSRLLRQAALEDRWEGRRLVLHAETEGERIADGEHAPRARGLAPDLRAAQAEAVRPVGPTLGGLLLREQALVPGHLPQESRQALGGEQRRDDAEHQEKAVKQKGAKLGQRRTSVAGAVRGTRSEKC